MDDGGAWAGVWTAQSPDGLEQIDLAFDGHAAQDFARMDAEMRLDDLSRKIALVLELRTSRLASEAKAEPKPEVR